MYKFIPFSQNTRRRFVNYCHFLTIIVLDDLQGNWVKANISAEAVEWYKSFEQFPLQYTTEPPVFSNFWDVSSFHQCLNIGSAPVIQLPERQGLIQINQHEQAVAQNIKGMPTPKTMITFKNHQNPNLYQVGFVLQIDLAKQTASILEYLEHNNKYVSGTTIFPEIPKSDFFVMGFTLTGGHKLPAKVIKQSQNYLN
jgi:hypothetical protein